MSSIALDSILKSFENLETNQYSGGMGISLDTLRPLGMGITMAVKKSRQYQNTNWASIFHNFWNIRSFPENKYIVFKKQPKKVYFTENLPDDKRMMFWESYEAFDTRGEAEMASLQYIIATSKSSISYLQQDLAKLKKRDVKERLKLTAELRKLQLESMAAVVKLRNIETDHPEWFI